MPLFGATPKGVWGLGDRGFKGQRHPVGPLNLPGCRCRGTGPISTPFPPFPPDLVALVCKLAGTEGILGNCHAPGADHRTALRRASGARVGRSAIHRRIPCFQIAAHEEAFGLDRLLKLLLWIWPRICTR